MQMRFFVVLRAFDKASCSSSAKSGASPQGPQVGIGSPAAPCVPMLSFGYMCMQKHKHADVFRFHISYK